MKETSEERGCGRCEVQECAILGTLLRGDFSARFLRRLSIRPTETENFIIRGNKRSPARPLRATKTIEQERWRHYVNVGPDMAK